MNKSLLYGKYKVHNSRGHRGAVHAVVPRGDILIFLCAMSFDARPIPPGAVVPNETAMTCKRCIKKVEILEVDGVVALPHLVGEEEYYSNLYHHTARFLQKNSRLPVQRVIDVDVIRKFVKNDNTAVFLVEVKYEDSLGVVSHTTLAGGRVVSFLSYIVRPIFQGGDDDDEDIVDV